MTQRSLALPFTNQFRIDGVEKEFSRCLWLIEEIFLEHGIAAEDVVVFLECVPVFHLCELSSQVALD
jgi:hypothetical protein